jgi:hypothetical protein
LLLCLYVGVDGVPTFVLLSSVERFCLSGNIERSQTRHSCVVRNGAADGSSSRSFVETAER